MVKGRPFSAKNGDLLALAHKTYLHASFDKDWLAYLICWAIIYNLEQP